MVPSLMNCVMILRSLYSEFQRAATWSTPCHLRHRARARVGVFGTGRAERVELGR